MRLLMLDARDKNKDDVLTQGELPERTQASR